MTDAEKLLWRHLRMKQFDGYKFRRQHPLGSFIVEFVCLEAGLIVEVDGGEHVEQKDSDAIRTAWLETKGFRVMRLWNNEVLNNIEGVKQAIMAMLLPPSQPSDETPSHSTKRANNARQVAGYPCKGEGAGMQREDV
jgi:very-short-patch-repair endonuclease